MSLVRFSARNHPQQAPRPDVDDRATSPEVFNPLHERFRFTIDVAALPHNAKLPRFYTPEDDGLACSWFGERVWCNPPYSNIRPWVEKAWHEWAGADRSQTIVMIVPANRTEQGWWQDLVEPHLRARRADFHCEFLRGRVRFIARDGNGIKPNERPPFGCCLLVWSV